MVASGLVPEAIVARGAAAIRGAFAELRRQGFAHAIVDAIEDRDLEAIGEAAADFKLITGGSGIALGLPENFRRRGLLDGGAADSLPAISGAAAVLSGSCSTATLAQVAYMKERAPAFTVDPIAVAEGGEVAQQALAWAKPLLGEQPILISATRTAREGRRGAKPARPRTRRSSGRGILGGDRPRPRSCGGPAVCRRRR